MRPFSKSGREEMFARFLSVVLFSLTAVSAVGQPLTFGHADDPREAAAPAWWRLQQNANLKVGLALIGDRWYGMAGGSAAIRTNRFSAGISQMVRYSTDGVYSPDVDELHDILRSVEFIRLNHPGRAQFHLRAGQIDRMRLGEGHLVDFYSSRAAFDHRTVGAEVMWEGTLLDVAAFTGDVTLDGTAGGRIGLRPLFWADDERTRSLEFGFNYVTDLRTHRRSETPLSGYNVDVRFDAVSWGDVYLSPFATFAWYDNQGSGLGIGADFRSPDFIDMLRFSLRFGMFYNGRGFVPGYVGSFYQVSNPYARVLDSETYAAGWDREEFADVALANALGGNTLVSEVRLLVFRQFEFWQQFKRHYGRQALSEYHLRLFFRSAERAQLDVGIDRGRLTSVFSLFQPMGDMSALTFNAHYRVRPPFWTFINAKYTFGEEMRSEAGERYYLVQRRFEPSGGIRFAW
jgi:hypothetical protein